MTHRCPVRGCPIRVPQDMLMCKEHWFQVPQELRTAVWRAWRRGAGRGTPAHSSACAEAILYVDNLQEAS